MRTRDEFLEQFLDELRGKLSEAYAEAESRRLAGDGGGSNADAAAIGRFMAKQLRWARVFLNRCYEHLHEPPEPVPAPVLNGRAAQSLVKGK